MKVLFLDIDGVLLCGEDLWRTGNHRYLPPEKIALLNQVARDTNCVTVISSIWRFDPTCVRLLRDAGFVGDIHPYWRTPSLPGDPGLPETQRGREIAKWLGDRKWSVDRPLQSYAIIDDSSDMLPEQKPHFVQCNFKTGIQLVHVQHLVRILNRNQVIAASFNTSQCLLATSLQP